MMAPRWQIVVGLGAALAPAPETVAQQQPQAREPRVGYVFPAGGRQGATFEITVGGQFLEAVHGIRVTGEGIKATVVDYYKPLPPGQAARLRDTLKELQEKKRAAAGKAAAPAAPTTRPTTRPVWTAEDEKLLTEVQKKLADFAPKPSSPAIAETVTLQVHLAPDARPGKRELRLATPARLTNPLPFFVSQWPEFAEKPSRQRFEPRQSVPMDEMTITLPAVVNGQIMPGGVDRYHFQGRKGQTVVAAAAARALIPYMADAVPGWFQAALTLLDSKGRQLAYCDDFRFSPDPLLRFSLPADGQYTLEVRDAIYRGREDFVYRIAVGEVPVVTHIFPLGGRAGIQTPVTADGWNLPWTRLLMDGRDKPAGICVLPTDPLGLLAQPAVFALDTLAEVTEEEPNDRPAQAQTITWPVVVNARIGRPGDVDVFRVDGRPEEELVVEVMARRLNSALDSVVEVTDVAGRRLALNDDQEDKGSGLVTHHADSLVRAKVPAGGACWVRVRDTQGHGGPEYAYRLRLSQPRPGFELRVAPSSIGLRRAASDPLTVHVLRRDGFTGEVALSLAGAPAGIKLSASRIPADKDQLQLTLTAAPQRTPGTVSLRLEGQATIDGKTVARAAVPADDMMQAFSYHHLVPAEELLLTVVRPAAPAATRPASGPARPAVKTTSPPKTPPAKTAAPPASTKTPRK